jgi:glycosyltransferase involved in cell wall biosynthesis
MYKTLSLIIPIYNEERNLPAFLRLLDANAFILQTELIFVDDGSSDASASIIEAHRFQHSSLLIRLKRNAGKGAAIRAGILRASGDVIGIQDADFEYQPADINQLLEAMISGKCDVAFGARFSPLKQNPRRKGHWAANKFLTALSNLCSGLHLNDMETCYKFIPGDILRCIELVSNRFGFEPEITAKLARLGIRIREIPVTYNPRNYDQGKKICWRDGVAAIWHIIRFNLLPGNSRIIARSKPNMLPAEGRKTQEDARLH